ncbi:MAG: DUF2267 domain-containing protein [Pseudomonadota bacterium]
MPMPWTYRHASKEFSAFLDDVRARMGLASDNMVYTAVDGVFQVFRRRLTAEQGLAFASVLPSVLRAMFVKDWTPAEYPTPFADRRTLTREVQAVRPHHNLTPKSAITDTAWAVRRCVDQRALDRVLARLPEGAADYWQVEVGDPAELDQRIV